MINISGAIYGAVALMPAVMGGSSNHSSSGLSDEVDIFSKSPLSPAVPPWTADDYVWPVTLAGIVVVIGGSLCCAKMRKIYRERRNMPPVPVGLDVL